MRINKILTVLVASCLIPTQVFAENFIVKPIKWGESNTATVEIKGMLDNKQAGENVMLIVAKPGTDLSTIVADVDKIIYQWEKVSVDNGEYVFSFKINPALNTQSGLYEAYVKSDSMAERVNKQIYYATQTDRDSAISEINNLDNYDTIISNNLTSYAQKFGLESFEPFAGANSIDLVNALKTKVQLAQFGANDYNGVQKFLIEQSVLSCYNRSNTIYIADTQNQLKNVDVIGFDDIAKTGNLFEKYNTVLNDTGKSKVINDLKGKSFTSYDDILEAFTTSVIINSVANTDLMGGGHYADILTAANISKTGSTLNFNNYIASSDKNYIATELRKIGTFASLEDLSAKIDNIVKNKPAGTPSKNEKPGGSNVSGEKGYSVILTNDGDGMSQSQTHVFSDVDTSHWAFNSIETLYQKGIVNGYPDKTFRPSDNVTREQVVKMLCDAFNITGEQTYNKFNDVHDGEWYSKYIYCAAQNGFVKGEEGGNFGIGKKMTRQDFAVMVYRILGEPMVDGNSKFADSDLIVAYAQNAVAYMSSMGYINGYPDNTFKPANSVTRAEAATILFNCIKETVK